MDYTTSNLRYPSTSIMMGDAPFRNPKVIEDYATIVAASTYLSGRKLQVPISGHDKRAATLTEEDRFKNNLLAHLAMILTYTRDASSVLALSGRIESRAITTTIFSENKPPITPDTQQSRLVNVPLLTPAEATHIIDFPYEAGIRPPNGPRQCVLSQLWPHHLD